MYEFFKKITSASPRKAAVFFGCFLLVLRPFEAAQRNEDLVNRLSSSTELSEFYGMIERNKLASAMLENAPMTVFAPTNEAFQKLKNRITKDDYLLFYHMCNIPYRLEDLPDTGGSINTVATGNPPLWLTRTSSNQVFINNARINPDSSYFANSPESSKRKVLHIISEVLQPLRMKVNDVTKLNPNAWGLLEKFDDFQLTNRISIFANSVKKAEKEGLFRDRGPNTYLIPVDDAFVKKNAADVIDSKVVDGHVIPDKVLFLNPTPEHEVYRTSAFTDLLKVQVSFPFDQSTKKRYVRSNTAVGDRNHPSGVVLSEIVAGNIPVSNGVVHLIKQPLMIIDKSIQQYIDENADGPISIFKQKLQHASAIFRSKLNQNGVTLFIPSNDAWKNENVEKVINNVTLLENILNLHLVTEKLTVNDIRERGSKEANTLNVGKKLYFNVIVRDTNRTLTVEGGGVNSTVSHSDIATTNGIIHIIDRVLGIPYATVGRKIATDPMLNTTYTLGKYLNFNNRLDDITQNYTFFAPNDLAWVEFYQSNPNEYNSLLKAQHNAYSALEKHLVVSGNFTMAELKKIANSSYVLPTANGALTISVKEEPNKGYEIFWNGQRVQVYKADVRCTNGIIHIIDKVLLTPKDIQVNGGNTLRITRDFAVSFIVVVLPLYSLFNYQLSSPIF